MYVGAELETSRVCMETNLIAAQEALADRHEEELRVDVALVDLIIIMMMMIVSSNNTIIIVFIIIIVIIIIISSGGGGSRSRS